MATLSFSNFPKSVEISLEAFHCFAVFKQKALWDIFYEDGVMPNRVLVEDVMLK
ncbi:MAG: hypothetical protein V1644_01105 [Candidatus Micrarchaeota archaeon]